MANPDDEREKLLQLQLQSSMTRFPTADPMSQTVTAAPLNQIPTSTSSSSSQQLAGFPMISRSMVNTNVNVTVARAAQQLCMQHRTCTGPGAAAAAHAALVPGQLAIDHRTVMSASPGALAIGPGQLQLAHDHRTCTVMSASPVLDGHRGSAAASAAAVNDLNVALGYYAIAGRLANSNVPSGQLQQRAHDHDHEAQHAIGFDRSLTTRTLTTLPGTVQYIYELALS